MSSLDIDLFVEDEAHEHLLAPLIARVGNDEGHNCEVQVRSARRGEARALREFDRYQKKLADGFLPVRRPDIIVVAIDGNCVTAARRRQEIIAISLPGNEDRVVAACPDPHIERWYLADQRAAKATIGLSAPLPVKKCGRDTYKALLAHTVREAGHPTTFGGVEFGRDLAEAIDIERLSRSEPSFNDFVRDLRSAMKRNHISRP